MRKNSSHHFNLLIFSYKSNPSSGFKSLNKSSRSSFSLASRESLVLFCGAFDGVTQSSACKIGPQVKRFNYFSTQSESAVALGPDKGNGNSDNMFYLCSCVCVCEYVISGEHFLNQRRLIDPENTKKIELWYLNREVSFTYQFFSLSPKG